MSSHSPAAPATAVSASGLRWELVALPTRLTMADRASFLLRRQVTNDGTAAADAMHASASFAVGGASSMELDLAFGNGARESQWSALPPGVTVFDDRDMGESLFPAPGDYTITMSTDGVTVGTTVHVDP